MPDNKLTKSIGEHWACSELARRGWSPALTRDGLERTDILAVATHLLERPTVEIQVKTANENVGPTSWLLGLKAQMPARSRREWFVLTVVPRNRDESIRGYVVPRDHVAAVSWVIHQHWLTDPDVPSGKRNTPVALARVEERVWADYRSRWDLLDRPAEECPLMFPLWIEQRALEKRVGLPPAHPWRSELPTGWRTGVDS